AEARAAIEPRNGRAFGGCGDVEIGEPGAFAMNRAAAGKQRAVDLLTDRGADEAADLRGGDAGPQHPDRAADGAADRRAGYAKNKRRHPQTSPLSFPLPVGEGQGEGSGPSARLQPSNPSPDALRRPLPKGEVIGAPGEVIPSHSESGTHRRCGAPRTD